MRRPAAAGSGRVRLHPQRRFMGADGHHAAFHVSEFHTKAAKAYFTAMWLWMLWRFKEDGMVWLGLEHPWDHVHAHVDVEALYSREPGTMPKRAVEDEEDEDDE